MRAWILLLLVGAAYAVPKSPQRIVGGEDTTIQEYPYLTNMEFLFWSMWWLQWCGGTLLTTSTVLSAAHCYSESTSAEWRVRLGSSFATTGGSIYPISRIVTHPQFSPETLDFDVAIIRLDTRVFLTEVVGLGRISGPNYQLPDGAAVKAVGWGALWYEGPSPENLQQTELNVVNFELCAQRYSELRTQFNSYPELTPRMLCAGILDEGGKAACQGDYGGPLLHNDVVVGITSWGYGCADNRYPGISTRVSVLTDWISVNVVNNGG